MAERVARRHRTEDVEAEAAVVPGAVLTGAALAVDAVIEVDAEVKEEKLSLSNNSVQALYNKDDVCLICGHAPGRTNKRPHLLAKHPEVNSDKHPLVIEKLQAKNTGFFRRCQKRQRQHQSTRAS
jgi:hypothetical protein